MFFAAYTYTSYTGGRKRTQGSGFRVFFPAGYINRVQASSGLCGGPLLQCHTAFNLAFVV
jgi:hypothetical protein